jgi:cytochrome c biogenesis protein CcdA
VSQTSPSTTLQTATPPVTATMTATSPVTSTAALTATTPTTGTAAAGASLAPTDGKPIHLAYFYQVGCKECDRAQYELAYLQSQYPNLVVDKFDVVTDAALSEWLGEKLGVQPDDRVVSPAVYVGNERLTKGAVSVGKLEPILAKYSTTGAEAFWNDWQASTAGTRVGGMLQHISLAAVLGAGVVDGLNPCAFVTIVFFIAYLAFIGRSSRDILLSGIAFTVGVFVAHLLLGLGLLRIFQAANMTSLGKWLYPIMAIMCLVLAAINFKDFFKARMGKLEDMQMRLPLRYRRWINKIIRENASMQAYVLAALFIGFVVAVIELVCTGQIYAVILSALSQPGLHGQALSYLVLYNLAFIGPLVIVFLLACYGISSDQLSKVVQQHTATVKLFTALLFLGFGLWLVYSFLPLFGIRLLG